MFSREGIAAGLSWAARAALHSDEVGYEKLRSEEQLKLLSR
jgi:hypothetical protein